MLVFQTSLMGVEPFSYVKISFVPKNYIAAGHVSEKGSIFAPCSFFSHERFHFLKELLFAKKQRDTSL